MLRALLALSALLLALPAGAPAQAPTVAPITAKDIDGKSWSLLSPAARQLDLLFFVATDCPISNRYAPEVARMCKEYSGRGVRCFMVYPDRGADVGTIMKYRQEDGLGATPVILDRSHALVRAVGARITPEAAIYSSAGRIYRGRINDLYVDVGRARRQATRHDVRLALDAALAGRPVTQPETEAVGCFITNP